VTIHASFHAGRNFFRDDITLPHRAVTLAAVDARLAVARMAKENEILNCVDLTCWEWPGILAEGRQTPDLFAVSLHGAMTGHAFRGRWKPRSLTSLDRCMTIHAFNLQRCVLLVTEMHRLLFLRGQARYGNENATSESE
jgi:hypothetical protein